jgi:hypothetical protein
MIFESCKLLYDACCVLCAAPASCVLRSVVIHCMLLLVQGTHQARHDVWQVVAIEAHIHHRTNDLQETCRAQEGWPFEDESRGENQGSAGALQEQY